MNYTHFEDEIDGLNRQAESKIWTGAFVVGFFIAGLAIGFFLSLGKTTAEDCLDAGFIPPRNSQQIQR